jgi:ATP-dependent helicase/nuclease subunit A
MTIYGAKGLDFEHVYLAQIHKRTGGFGTAAAVVRRLDDRAELSLFGWSSPAFVRAERLRDRQTRAERVRLLYVAMTRAKQRLVVSGGWAEPGEMVEAAEADTLAKLIAHRGDPEHLVDLIERGVDRETSRDPCVSWFLPALADDSSAPAQVREPTASAADLVALAREDAKVIGEARKAAVHRMRADWTAAASGGENPSEGTSTAPGVAATVGTAIHHLLEALDLSNDLEAQVLGRAEAVIAGAVSELDRAAEGEATQRLVRLIDGLCRGRLLERLAELAPVVVARELPVFLRPTDDDGTSVISGAVDLVYRDPENGRLVIADYKTDRVESDAGIAERVELYGPQLAIYATALEQAFDLDDATHTELWFLHADRIVRLS